MTGASSGIGEATARRLAREPDARLVLIARREDRLRALAAELGATTSVLALDLLADDAPERVRTHVEAELGSLNLLVNNAGGATRGTFAAEGFPHHGLTSKRRTAWTVGSVDSVAEAIVAAGPGGRAERYVPRGYGALAAVRTLAPGLVRRVLAS